MIKCRRKKLGLTAKELADKLEISTSYMSELENRAFVNIKIEFLKKLSIELNLNIYDLLDWFLKK